MEQKIIWTSFMLIGISIGSNLVREEQNIFFSMIIIGYLDRFLTD